MSEERLEKNLRSLLALVEEEPAAAPEIDVARAARIAQAVEARAASAEKSRRTRWPLFVAAAAAAAILIASGLHVAGLMPTRYAVVELFNVTAGPVEKTLSDGTLVTVAPGAKAVARGRDDARGVRQLILLEEGAIEVCAPKAPDGETAVRVETPEGLWVETLGTTFAVTRTYENEKGERSMDEKKLIGAITAVLLVAVSEGEVRTGGVHAEEVRVARGGNAIVRQKVASSARAEGRKAGVSFPAGTRVIAEGIFKSGKTPFIYLGDGRGGTVMPAGSRERTIDLVGVRGMQGKLMSKLVLVRGTWAPPGPDTGVPSIKVESCKPSGELPFPWTGSVVRAEVAFWIPKGGDRVVARGVFQNLKGQSLQINRRRSILLEWSGELARRERELRGKVLEVTGTWIPAKTADEAEIERRRKRDAETTAQGAGLREDASPHLRVESWKVVAEKAPPGFKGFLRRAVATGKVPWGRAVNGLQARVVVENPVLRTDTAGFFQASLELRNVGKKPVTVPDHDPYALSLSVTDQASRNVAAKFARKLQLPLPKWIRVNPGETRRVRLSQKTVLDLKTVRNKPIGLLDTFVSLWHLPVGKYRVAAGYSSKLWEGSKRTPADAWTGKLSAPPVSIEVKPKTAIAWGKTVNGLQAGLSAEKTVFRAGDPIRFTVRLRNVSERKLSLDRAFVDMGLCFEPMPGGKLPRKAGGHWWPQGIRFRLDREVLLAKGHEHQMPAVVKGKLGYVGPDLDVGGAKLENSDWGPPGIGVLPPGKYRVSVRVSRDAGSARDARAWSGNATTGAVEIEIVAPAGEEKALAFRNLHPGPHMGEGKGEAFEVVRSEAELRNLIARIRPGPSRSGGAEYANDQAKAIIKKLKLATIFEKEMALYAFNEKTPAGKSLVFTRVAVIDGEMRAHLAFKDVKSAGKYRPYSLVACPRQALHVVFYMNGKEVARSGRDRETRARARRILKAIGKARGN